MKERPILFSGPMVRAILSGQKTVTRRVVKSELGGRGEAVGDRVKYWSRGEEDPTRWCGRDGLGSLGWVRCPYGEPDDRLWVRERQRVDDIETMPDGLTPNAVRVRYEADGALSDWVEWPERLQGTPEVGKCLPYGGFRESGRITLDVTKVGIERLQDITTEGIRAEGVDVLDAKEDVPGELVPREYLADTVARSCFQVLWNGINAKRGHPWASNPWVWVVEFRIHHVETRAAA